MAGPACAAALGCLTTISKDRLIFTTAPPRRLSLRRCFWLFNPPTAPVTGQLNYMSQPYVAAGTANPFPYPNPAPRNLNFAAAGLLPFTYYRVYVSRLEASVCVSVELEFAATDRAIAGSRSQLPGE